MLHSIIRKSRWLTPCVLGLYIICMACVIYRLNILGDDSLPKLYLSPSLQEWNKYVDGGNEEYYMNLIADEMVPYLTASGIEFTRNEPSQTLSQAISQSNAGNYDLHLAIHSNAGPESLAGKLQGTDVYYYANSAEAKRAADIIANNFKSIYPNPSMVKTVANTSLAELRRTRAPAVLIEVAYHDNKEDAQWIRDNISEIARNLVLSVTEYFDLPFRAPEGNMIGVVNTSNTALNIREEPSTNSEVIGSVPKGTRLSIMGQADGWYLINYNGVEGYVRSDYVMLQ